MVMLRLDVERRGEPLVVVLVVVAAVGERRDAVAMGQRRGDVVLGAERVAGAERELGAAGDENAREVGRLGGDVQAGADARAFQRLLFGEAVHQGPQDRHLGQCPFDSTGAGLGQVRILYVVSWRVHAAPSQSWGWFRIIGAG